MRINCKECSIGDTKFWSGNSFKMEAIMNEPLAQIQDQFCCNTKFVPGDFQWVNNSKIEEGIIAYLRFKNNPTILFTIHWSPLGGESRGIRDNGTLIIPSEKNLSLIQLMRACEDYVVVHEESFNL